MDTFKGVPFKCRYKLNSLALLIIAILFAQCDSNTLKLTEGDEAELDFQYPCSSTRVTLRMGNKAPFYDSELETSSLPKRYSVQDQNDTENKNCSIHLAINPVTRSDEGTCILTVYQGDEILDEHTKRIGLLVDYPPGKATCELSHEYRVGDWVSLHCTAPVGTLPGEIKCFQRGMRIPPVAMPFQTNQVLEQTFWVVKRSYPTFCCTSTQQRPTDLCECRDSVWDPSNDTQSNSNIDPCPKTSSDPSISQIADNSNETMNALAQTPAKHTSENRYLLTIFCMFIPVLLIVMVFVVISGIILFKGKRESQMKMNKLKKKKSNSQEKAVYMKLPTA